MTKRKKEGWKVTAHSQTFEHTFVSFLDVLLEKEKKKSDVLTTHFIAEK